MNHPRKWSKPGKVFKKRAIEERVVGIDEHFEFGANLCFFKVSMTKVSFKFANGLPCYFGFSFGQRLEYRRRNASGN